MSLTAEDLDQIRTIVREVVTDVVEPMLSPISGELEALRNDIKEIYSMISDIQTNVITDISFKKKTIEEKLLIINAELLAAAKSAGINLPR